jgi:hypothetical protein
LRGIRVPQADGRHRQLMISAWLGIGARSSAGALLGIASRYRADPERADVHPARLAGKWAVVGAT